jgi:hypothetical protein
MRITASALAIYLATCAALAAPASARQGASARQMALVELPGASDRSIGFVDLGGVRRGNGWDVEVQALSVTATYEDEAKPADGSLRTYRILCEWNAYVVTGRAKVDSDGVAAPAAVPEPGAKFITSRTSEADIAAIACDPQAKAPAGALASLKDAMARGASLKRWAVRDPNAPVPTVLVGPPPKQAKLQNFGGQGPSAYALTHVSKETGAALFLDWGNFRRTGDVVEALIFEVLAHDPPGEFAQRSVMRHASVEIDCKAKVMRMVAAQTFGADLKPEYSTATPWTWRPVAGSQRRTDLMNAACKGRKPKQTLATMADAAAMARAGK